VQGQIDGVNTGRERPFFLRIKFSDVVAERAQGFGDSRAAAKRDFAFGGRTAQQDDDVQ
jgi:hypothetical protein